MQGAASIAPYSGIKDSLVIASSGFDCRTV